MEGPGQIGGSRLAWTSHSTRLCYFKVLLEELASPATRAVLLLPLNPFGASWAVRSGFDFMEKEKNPTYVLNLPASPPPPSVKRVFLRDLDLRFSPLCPPSSHQCAAAAEVD